VRALHSGLGVRSLDELEAACRDNRVAGLGGFGAKSQEKILTGIVELKRNQGRFRIDTAVAITDALGPAIAAIPGVTRVEATGSMRRGAEEYDEAVFVVQTDDSQGLMEGLSARSVLTDVHLEAGMIFGIAAERFPVRIHTARPRDYPAVLFRTTGSDAHVRGVTAALAGNGFELTPTGVLRGGKPATIAREEEIYGLAGMQLVPPELREGLDEIDLARADRLPELVTEAELRGMLHVHSRWSDGRHTIAELVDRCRVLGYQYLLMCDHSKAAFYANGLDERRLEEQGREIDAINNRLNPAEFRVLKGIECDILADGALDLEADALAALDAVVISIHSRFDLPKEAQTARLCRALEHPATTILGHSTGRLLLTRRGYEIDHLTVIDAAAAHGKSIELNCNPYRLDLEWRMIREARRRGVPIAINPDAHTLDDLLNMRYGLTIARKGMLTRDDVLNTRSVDDFLGWVRTSQGS
jgi:DNA polymerase (family 10)